MQKCKSCGKDMPGKWAVSLCDKCIIEAAPVRDMAESGTLPLGSSDPRVNQVLSTPAAQPGETTQGAAQFAQSWEGFKGQPSMITEGKTLDPLAPWQIAVAVRFAEAYAASLRSANEGLRKERRVVKINLHHTQEKKPIAAIVLSDATSWVEIEEFEEVREALDEARKEVGRLSGLLRQYGNHKPKCSMIGKPCSCEWSEIRAALAPSAGTEEGKDKP